MNSITTQTAGSSSAVPPAPVLVFATRTRLPARSPLKLTKPSAHISSQNPATLGTSTRTATSPVVLDADIRVWTKYQRGGLHKGFEISIFANGVFAGSITQDLLCKVSLRAQKILVEEGALPTIHLPTYTDVAATQFLLRYLKDTRNTIAAFRLPQKNFVDDIKVLLVANCLGIKSQYTQYVFDKCWKILCNVKTEIKEDMDKVAAVELVSNGPKHALLQCAAKRLALLEFRGEISNMNAYKKYMAEHSKLAGVKKVHLVELEKVRRQKEEKLQHAEEQRGLRRREQSAAQRGCQSGVHMVTADEASFVLRGR